MEKVVLAYSGGLDTTVILKWLIDKGFDVVAYIADIGQKDDFNDARQRALSTGASSVYVEDLKESFVTDYIFPVLKAGAVYEGRYLLGTSIARPLISKTQIEIAAKEEAAFVAHGATGKGNDQVRFELSYYALNPEIQVLAPWKTEEFLSMFQGRTELLEYAKEQQLEVQGGSVEKPPYSMDANLMHISYEGGDLENPLSSPSQSMFQLTLDPEQCSDEAVEIELHFLKGEPKLLRNCASGEEFSGGLELFEQLNFLGGQSGIGRIDIVENRYVGIKSRGVYEAPAATILWAALQDLRVFVLDKELLKLSELLATKMAETIYQGYWFSPEMKFLLFAFEQLSETLTGVVKLKLYKGNLSIQGRASKFGAYNATLASMDAQEGFNQADAAGFIKVNALRLMNQQGGAS